MKMVNNHRETCTNGSRKKRSDLKQVDDGNEINMVKNCLTSDNFNFQRVQKDDDDENIFFLAKKKVFNIQQTVFIILLFLR